MKLLSERTDDGGVILRSPSVGWWCEAPRPGTVLVAGDPAGRLEVLGCRYGLVLPDGVSGRVVGVAGEGRSRHAVGYRDVVLRLDATTALGASEQAGAAELSKADGVSSGGFLAPSAGRFYARPSPDEPPFISAGDRLVDGQVIGVIEVMKTFTQLHYQGPEASVIRVVPQDGDDIEQGDTVLELAPLKAN